MPSFSSASSAGRISPANVDPALAHQRGDQMGERREVARGADAALRTG